MKMFGLLTQHSPNGVFLSIVLGMFAGISYSLIIPLLLSVIGAEEPGFNSVGADFVIIFGWQISNYKFAALFALVCLLILSLRTISQIVLLRIAIDVNTELRSEVYGRIAAAPTAQLEKVGPAKLMAALTTDVPRVVGGARLLPELLTNVITLVSLMSYLAYLSPDVFWFVLGCIAFGAITYQIPMLIGRHYLIRSRKYMDKLHESIRGLIYGFKELKLNDKKRVEYFDQHLLADEMGVKSSDKIGNSVLSATVNYGSLINFFVIGAASFILVNHSLISTTELIGVIMVLLYITGPIGVLLNFIPQYAYARISLKKLDDLNANLSREPVKEVIEQLPEWDHIGFRGVTFEHQDENRKHNFRLGPVDFEIRKGEVTFIIGGNGSGKSTLAKLLSLHYLPSKGTVRFGETLATEDTVQSLRQDIAVIYSDYYLFKSLMGVDDKDVSDIVNHYLKVFELDKKVDFGEGRFSTISLSDGQKRRLALLVAFVENKEFYLFDEWAADQDPKFKEVFYRNILPALKEAGKAVVVISHDDRYFDVADQIIRMEEGKSIGWQPPEAGAVPTDGEFSKAGNLKYFMR